MALRLANNALDEKEKAEKAKQVALQKEAAANALAKKAVFER